MEHTLNNSKCSSDKGGDKYSENCSSQTDEESCKNDCNDGYCCKWGDKEFVSDSQNNSNQTYFKFDYYQHFDPLICERLKNNKKNTNNNNKENTQNNSEKCDPIETTPR